MKYFMVYYYIVDGEYNYLQEVPVRAEDITQAEVEAMRHDREMVKGDFREVKFSHAIEVTEKQWKVLASFV